MRTLLQNPRLLTLAAMAASAAVLGAALAFQFLGGLAPCPMCIWQRWPHVAVIALGALALLVWRGPGRLLLALGAAAALTGAGLGVFHAGVEQRWWEGPSSCSAPMNVGDMSTDELLNQIMSTPLVRCERLGAELGLERVVFVTVAPASAVGAIRPAPPPAVPATIGSPDGRCTSRRTTGRAGAGWSCTPGSGAAGRSTARP